MKIEEKKLLKRFNSKALSQLFVINQISKHDKYIDHLLCIIKLLGDNQFILPSGFVHRPLFLKKKKGVGVYKSWSWSPYQFLWEILASWLLWHKPRKSVYQSLLRFLDVLYGNLLGWHNNSFFRQLADITFTIAQTGCLSSASASVGCAAIDFKCQCSPEKTAAITEAALACVIGACGASTGLLVQSAAAAVRECAASAAPGVTFTSPSAASPASEPATSIAPASTSNAEAAATHSSRPASSTATHSNALPPFPTTTDVRSTPSSPSPSGTLGSSSRPFSSTSSSSSSPFTGSTARAFGPAAALLGALFAAILICWVLGILG